MNDLREQLEIAYEEDTDEGEEGASTDTEGAGGAEGDATEDVPSSGEVQATSEDTEDSPAVQKEPDPTLPEADASEAGAVPPDAGGNDGPKPPVGWGPDAREGWNSIPKAAQDQITKREREVDDAIRNTSDARKSHAGLQQLTQTYGAVMAAEGATHPLQAFDTLMQTVSQLRMGSPQQKAQTVAELIAHFGVDIGALDNTLVGERAEPSPEQQMGHMIDQRMEPVNQMMGQLAGMQQQRHVTQNQEVGQEVEAFAQKNEFLNDVRNDMADLMDMATQRGQAMDLQEAYDKACQVNPQVQAVIRQRFESKKAAASSVSGQGAATTAPKDASLGDTLREAWASYG